MQRHPLKIKHANSIFILGLTITLTACSSNIPSTQHVQEKIANQLIKDTMGKLFDVESVIVEHGELTPEQDYLVTAKYTLRYTHSLQSYIEYMFKDTQLDNRIDSSAVKNEVREKLVAKYGQATVGTTRSFQGKFVFRKEAFGWEIQDPRDYSAIKPFLP